MKKLACTFIFALGVVTLASAAKQPAAEAPAAEEQAPAAFELKNKSAFVLDENSRNPFWPIGWKPTPKQAAATGMEHAGPEIGANAFIVSSITVDNGGKWAIINGKPMGEGQVFGLQLGGQTYQVTVKAIQDGQVILGRRDQEIAVPLRRR